MMKKIIIILALIGKFLIPVNSLAFDCTSYLPSYVSSGGVTSSMLDFVQKYDFFINVENSPIRNNSVCSPVQITDDVSNIYVSSDYVSPNSSDRALVISCIGGDCITDPDRIGGSWSHWDNSLKRLVATDGSYIGLDGVFHFAVFYVSTPENFIVNGKRMDESGGPDPDVPVGQLPLVPAGCQLLSATPIDSLPVSKVRCGGVGKTDGIRYESYIMKFSPNTSAAGAQVLQESRDSGVEVYDSREQEIRDLKNDLAETHDSTRVNEKGAEIKFSGSDYKVYVPENSFDGVPFVLSDDFVVDFSSEPDVTNDPALFAGTPGSTLLQKEGIELLAQLFDDNASTNNAGNLSLQITENGAELTFKNSGIGISSVQNEGLGLTQADIEAIRDSLIGSSYGAGGSRIFIGSGGGSSSGEGDGGQLPTDPAPDAGDGIGNKGDQEIYVPADFLTDSDKDCQTIECVFQPYKDQFQSLPFTQVIQKLIPPDVGSVLPVFNGVVFGSPVAIDLGKISGAFNLLKAIILLTATWMAVNIIINRQTS